VKRYTLYTTRYAKQVNECIKITQTQKCGSEYALHFAWEGGTEALAHALFPILARAAQGEHAIYRTSPAMRKLAQALRETRLYEVQVKGLALFLRHNRNLHIEGYVRFRMGDYIEGLDMLSYRLIKQMNLYAKKDWL